jgi:DNA invertase Pin-like site-specific DNA recombinase
MGQKETKPLKPVQQASDKMFDMLYEFKNMARQFERESVKSARQEDALKIKVKDAIKKNMMENAKIIATDAIRKKNDAQRYKVLSSKLDTVYSRLQNAYQTQKVNILLVYDILLVDGKYV